MESPIAELLAYVSPRTSTWAQKSRTLGRFLIFAVSMSLIVGVSWWMFENSLNRFDITVVVANDETVPIRRVEFYFNGRTIAVDNIAPGTTVRRVVTFRGSGSLNYAVKSPPMAYPPGVAASYLDPDCKGYKVGVRLRNGVVENF